MRRLFQYEWKRYSIMFVLTVAVLVLYFLVSSSSSYFLFEGYSEELVRWGAFYMSEYTYIFTNLGDLPVIVVLYLLFEIMNTVLKRKKEYHEFVRTIPIKRWKQTLFYYLADAAVLSIPCVIYIVIKLVWFNSKMNTFYLSANWISQICFYSIITHVVSILFLLAVFTMIKTVVVSNVWKIPVAFIIMLLLGYTGVIMNEAKPDSEFPIVHLYYELCDFENNVLLSVYDATLYLEAMSNAEDASAKMSFGDAYEKDIKEWVEKTYDVTTYENGELYMGYAELTKEQLYKGEINPKVQILYKGEPIQKRFIELEIMEKDDIREARIDARDLLEFDVNLCLLEQYLDHFTWTYDIIRFLIAIIAVAVTCMISGKCYAQKKGFYFKGVKYVFAGILGLFAYSCFIITLDENVVKSVILAFVVAAIAVWFMMPNRKELILKK